MRNVLFYMLILFIKVTSFAQNAEVSTTGKSFRCLVSNGATNRSITNCITPANFNASNATNNSVPEITINVNMHVGSSNFFPTPADAITAARTLLTELNTLYTNFDPLYRLGNTSTSTPITTSKIKFKLYSESSNTQDTYGGIWLYPTDTYLDQYPQKVVNIRLRSLSNNCVGAQLEIRGSSAGIGTSGTYIEGQNFFCQGNSGPVFFGSLMAHEMGHRLGLDHPAYCSNPCAGIDINPIAECNANCNGPRCTSTPDANSGFGNFCGANINECNPCDLSNLLTSSCFRYPRTMTACQWTVVFNDILTNRPQYARICPTTTSFTLPTSPLNDYRATGLIASTSLIAVGRMVDYWANTVELNPGFCAELGSTFVAGTSSFPCCSNPSAAPSSSERTTPDATPGKVALNVNDEKESVNSYPNPFSGNITISLTGAEVDITEGDLIISDVQGKTVYSGKISINSEVSIPTQSWEKGVYSLKVVSGDRIWARKLIHL
jgi:Secretion system C-terminal sorting domain/Metallo-peptidase family M12B Reprolysin-like